MTKLDGVRSKEKSDLLTVGERIAWSRAQKGMSAAALGKCIGRSRAAISLYEIGKNTPPVSMIEAIAKAVGQDARWLVFGNSAYLGGLENALQGQVLVGPVVEFGDPFAIFEKIRSGSPEVFKGISDVAVLAMDAPHFELKSGDVLLLHPIIEGVMPDGKLYAITSTAGATVVRSEPLLDRESNREVDGPLLLLTTGNGQSFTTSNAAIHALGRVGGWLHRMQ